MVAPIATFALDRILSDAMEHETPSTDVLASEPEAQQLPSL
jgi:hypothetical protein